MLVESGIVPNMLGRTGNDVSSADTIARALETVRRHLDMDIGFISEFIGDERIFRYVSSTSDDAPIVVGQRVSLEKGYCRKIVDGALPQLIPDTSALPALAAIAETTLLPIGSHISVPIKLADGTVFGTFCCFSRHPIPSLNQRDLNVLKIVADLVAAQIQTSAAESVRTEAIVQAIERAIAAGEPNILFQPVFDIGKGVPVGAEALSRFAQVPYRTPDIWFNDAAEVGLQPQLEIIAVRNAIEAYRPVWRSRPNFYLAVNTSVTTVCSPDFAEVLKGAPLDRMIIEITEHDEVADYALLNEALHPLKAKGIRIAVDDAGSGYASLRHILRIKPDIIKLDISLTRDIDKDPMRDALAAAVVQFTRKTGSAVVAEGIETDAEARAMARLGIRYCQGFLLGRPGSVDQLLASGKFSVR